MTDTDIRVGERHLPPTRQATVPARGAGRGPDRTTGRRPTSTRPRSRPSGPAPDTSGSEGADVAVNGLLDIVDGQAWVRADGYLPGPDDTAVSAAQVRSLGLRRGDHVTGTVRTTGEDQRRTSPAAFRVDEINGEDSRRAGRRPDFYKLTALYPQERLRLETEPHILTTRVIDLVMPIGKGQRALIVSPPKAGKTMVLQAIANAITHNNPDCHLMVVLVDERPEEVTDMQRSIEGEVIAATFDRPPGDHTALAELAIERAKRLVEAGRDVVVLLDSITRLARAYNLAAPARGRTMSGGIDSTALYPPKRFLGAARNIENGGSLTILATALVETGSAMDTVIFEEFKSTGNAELKLDRGIAESRLYPAIDIQSTGTRHDETLVAPTELALMYQLRRALGSQDRGQSLQQLLGQLRTTTTNNEFLRHLARSLPQA
jgi:transcription termination factor Rho